MAALARFLAIPVDKPVRLERGLDDLGFDRISSRVAHRDRASVDEVPEACFARSLASAFAALTYRAHSLWRQN
jgi:hypothetical protein